MGNHYLPQFYLKGFTESPNIKTIWVYRKGDEEPFKTSIRKIAQENKLYSPEMEQYLANEVEEPANKVIRKIREKRPLLYEEKVTLSKYMMTLWKRVPQRKIWAEEKAPEIMDSVFDRIDNELVELGKQKPSKIEIVEKRRNELRELRVNKNIDFIYNIWQENIPPDKTPQSVDVLSQMTWRFLVVGDEQYFITSDNPLFFFKWMGIGKKESEVTFPISKNIALWATWRIDLNEDYFAPRNQFVKEINRRTASIAAKFLFSPFREEWVQVYANKTKFKLNRVI
jgi:hypothetical protein